MYMDEGNRSTCTLVQEMFFKATYNVQIRAEHLNFQFSHVAKFITKVIHWMSFNHRTKFCEILCEYIFCG